MTASWRRGEASEAKTRISYDYGPGGSSRSSSRTRSPSPHQYERRDDAESSSRAQDISEDKVQKFDELLKKIESERKRMLTDNTQSRIGIIATPRRANLEGGSASKKHYDYAQRAKELRMSFDGMPAVGAGTPKRSERECLTSTNYELSHRAKNSTPRSMLTPRSVGLGLGKDTPMRSSSPMSSRMSFDSTPKRSEREGPPPSYDFSHRARDSTPRSLAHTPIKSASPFAPRRAAMENPAPSQVNNEFKAQVEQFHASLIAAHDTIASLERDVRTMKKKLSEKDDCIEALERRNKSLNETLQENRDEITAVEKERSALLEDRNESAKKHRKELDQLSAECEGYKKHADNISKLSAECDETVKSIQKSKSTLENTLKDKDKEISSLRSEIKRLDVEVAEGSLARETAKAIEKTKAALESTIDDKDKMIGSLRKEIKRLNEELADGSFVRAQAIRAEENAKQLELELAKSKMDHASATTTILDLELKLKNNTEEAEKDRKEKCEEIETLKSQLLVEKSTKEKAGKMIEKTAKLESELSRTNLENEDLTDKVKASERRLEQANKKVKDKDEEIERLEKEVLDSESREKELKRMIENNKRDIENQRSRFENYDRDCAMEQETVAALEQAIEELENAHDASNQEIARLQYENQHLSKTLEEAEKYMLSYKEDLDDAGHFKSMLDELRDINANLDQELRAKEDRIRELNKKEEGLLASLKAANQCIANFDDQIKQTIQSSMSESRERISDLENQVTKKQDDLASLQKELLEFKISSQVSRKEVEELREELKSRKTNHDDAEKILSEIRNEVYERDSQLEELKTNKGKMLANISKLENDLSQLNGEHKSCLDAKLDSDSQLVKAQKEAKMAWLRVHTLEENMKTLEESLFMDKVDKSEADKLHSQVALLKEQLAKRQEQLDESKKGIADAQKMIYKLMNTVQDLRNRAKFTE